MQGFFLIESALDLVTTLVFKEDCAVLLFYCNIYNVEVIDVGIAVVAIILSAEFLVELKVV